MGTVLDVDDSTPPVESSRVEREGREALSGHRRGLRAVLPFIGPAFVASVAYIDPGNFATNIQGGAQFGYELLWVILLANLMAMLIQTLSAKLGIATGRNLPELCRQHLPLLASLALWVVSELAAMATDIAEFVGASVGLNILLGLPLIVCAALVGIATYALLLLEGRGARPLERVIMVLIGVISIGYVIETFLSHPSWSGVAQSFAPPSLSSSSLFIAVGIIGATVMPHVIYLHSSLTSGRIKPQTVQDARRILHFEVVDVVLAMGLAGLVNGAMLIAAAAAFHFSGHTGVADLRQAYRTLEPLLGSLAAIVFAIALLASGLSSSVVGTMAGQVIMQGLVGFHIPLWVRRLVTMLPSFIVIGLGMSPTQVIILSQVLLSITLPAPLLALIFFTSSRRIMGPALANKVWTTLAAGVVTTVIIALNVVLLTESL
ncbi:MAG: Nramp family divalent metal transporter [Chloroflexi bacterium]|nr:Nramp family divalent metal transporter [Chloroflexota bacterium]